MKLRRKDGRLFTRRELDQGRHLRKALRGRHQKGKKQMSLQPLKASAATSLNASNGFVRARWFRRIAARICRHLQASGPDWIPKKQPYLVTVVDWKDVVRDDGKDDFVVSSWQVGKVKSKFARELIGLDFFGMIDVALYVSTRTVYRVPRVMVVHGHFLVWNTTEGVLRKYCDDINSKTNSVLPYSRAADWRHVKDGDLLQVLWYITKMPRKQYQLWRRTKGLSLKQYKRAINGVNAVRLYEAMQQLTLGELTIAGGDGLKLRDMALQDIALGT